MTGRVVGISPRKTTGEVRLRGIDAPESKQASGARAKQELSLLAFGKEAGVEIRRKDRRGESLGRVFVGTRWSAAGLRGGIAATQGRTPCIASQPVRFLPLFVSVELLPVVR